MTWFLTQTHTIQIHYHEIARTRSVLIAITSVTQLIAICIAVQILNAVGTFE
jgi:hypothetical protein